VNSRAKKPPRKFEATKKGQEIINPMITTAQEKKQRDEEAKKKAEEAKKKEEEEEQLASKKPVALCWNARR